MGWSYNFWAGDFYQKGLAAAEFLTEYSKHFDTVEVDSTFYRIPNTSMVAKWRAQTPEHFLFSAKFPRIITHQKMLRNCEEDVGRFIDRISQLQRKLGPLLLQFPSTFKPEHTHLLRDFLPSLPKGHRLVVEVRNENMMNERLYSLLRENGVALALVDSALMPISDAITSDFTYIRWEGNRKKAKGTMGKTEVDRAEDIKRWAEKIRRLLDVQGEVFGYFSKYYSGSPTNDATQLLKLFGLP
jgi:uncharacterized protein YecE (DUF72 family)